MPSQRTFVSPSGRQWTAALFVFPSTGTGLAGQPPSDVGGAVLRFTSGDLVLDAIDFPHDWATLPDAALVELVRRAQPPRIGGPAARPQPALDASARSGESLPSR